MLFDKDGKIDSAPLAEAYKLLGKYAEQLEEYAEQEERKRYSLEEMSRAFYSGALSRSSYLDIAGKMFVVDPLPTGALPVFKKENNPSELNQEPKQLKQGWIIVEEKACFSRPAKIEADLAYTVSQKEEALSSFVIIKNRDVPPQKLSLMEEEDKRFFEILEEIVKSDTSTKISSKKCNVCNKNVTTCSQDIDYVCYGCRSMFDGPAE